MGAAPTVPIRRRSRAPAVESWPDRSTHGILGRLVTPLSRFRHPFLPHPKLFSLKLFGGASPEGPAGALIGRAAQRRRLALLTMLAASGGGVTRDKLPAYLWPEADEERGRHLLSNSL